MKPLWSFHHPFSALLALRETLRQCQTRRVARRHRMFEKSDFRAPTLTLNQDYLQVRHWSLPEEGITEFAKVLPDTFVNSLRPPFFKAMIRCRMWNQYLLFKRCLNRCSIVTTYLSLFMSLCMCTSILYTFTEIIMLRKFRLTVLLYFYVVIFLWMNSGGNTLFRFRSKFGTTNNYTEIDENQPSCRFLLR